MSNRDPYEQQPIDPEAVTLSALAHGRIGSVPWALVERGDGLVLAIGSISVPMDTPTEMLAAFVLGTRLRTHCER